MLQISPVFRVAAFVLLIVGLAGSMYALDHASTLRGQTGESSQNAVNVFDSDTSNFGTVSSAFAISQTSSAVSFAEQSSAIADSLFNGIVPISSAAISSAATSSAATNDTMFNAAMPEDAATSSAPSSATPSSHMLIISSQAFIPSSVNPIATSSAPIEQSSSSSQSSLLLIASSAQSSLRISSSVSSKLQLKIIQDDYPQQDTPTPPPPPPPLPPISVPKCGNGIVEFPEECDDNNRRDDDGCNVTCLLEIGICGDGIVQSLLGEDCEYATHDINLPYSCDVCLFASVACGDGTVDPGEACDEGPLNSTAPNAICRPNCHYSRCGDGILDNVEKCDDGNRLNDDGCDRYCMSEGTAAPIKFADTTQPQLQVLPTNFQNLMAPGMFGQQFSPPMFTTLSSMQMQFPLAQLRPLVTNRAPLGETGPAAVVVVGSGVAAGLGWMRRRRK